MSWWRPKVKKLNVQEAETKRLAVLLTELETATTQVLCNEFGFDGAEMGQVLERIREKFKTLKVVKASFQKQRLGLAAERFGLAASHVLTTHYTFGSGQVDKFLQRLVEVGNANRETA